MPIDKMVPCRAEHGEVRVLSAFVRHARSAAPLSQKLPVTAARFWMASDQLQLRKMAGLCNIAATFRVQHALRPAQNLN